MDAAPLDSARAPALANSNAAEALLLDDNDVLSTSMAFQDGHAFVAIALVTGTCTYDRLAVVGNRNIGDPTKVADAPAPRAGPFGSVESGNASADFGGSVPSNTFRDRMTTRAPPSIADGQPLIIAAGIVVDIRTRPLWLIWCSGSGSARQRRSIG